MDVLTPRGKIASEAQAEAIRAIEAGGRYRLREMHETEPAAFDCWIEDTLKQVSELAEVKCRWMSSVALFERFGGKWILSYDKLESLRLVTLHARVAVSGILYCMEDGCVLLRRLWDRSGRILTPYSVCVTETQKTVNGGTATRNNAYIDMSGSEIFPAKVYPTNPYQ